MPKYWLKRLFQIQHEPLGIWSAYQVQQVGTSFQVYVASDPQLGISILQLEVVFGTRSQKSQLMM